MAAPAATPSVVVYCFPSDEAASDAAARLLGRMGLPVDDVSLATHAVMGGSHDGLPLLAAAVAPESVDVAVAILEEAGGTCVEVRAPVPGGGHGLAR